jgi:hypothetical protein
MASAGETERLSDKAAELIREEMIYMGFLEITRQS